MDTRVEDILNSEPIKNFYKSGWRPLFGWLCGAGFALHIVLAPILTWIAALMGHPIPFPSMGANELMALVSGVVGLGAYRTKEKLEGVTD